MKKAVAIKRKKLELMFGDMAKHGLCVVQERNGLVHQVIPVQDVVVRPDTRGLLLLPSLPPKLFLKSNGAALSDSGLEIRFAPYPRTATGSPGRREGSLDVNLIRAVRAPYSPLEETVVVRVYTPIQPSPTTTTPLLGATAHVVGSQTQKTKEHDIEQRFRYTSTPRPMTEDLVVPAMMLENNYMWLPSSSL